MPILRGEALVKAFGGRRAVDNVSFQVREGEILGLIGPNGAGKTTLFNLISGALEADGGTIVYKGRKINGLKPYKICRMGLARTFQKAKNFNGMNVYQNVLMGAMYGKAGRTAEAAARETEAVLDFVGLARLKNRPLTDIPLAFQKRVEVARALATKPDVLMLDEMMAGLNPAEVSEAMELVERIRAGGVTIVMIEHVMKAIMSMCDRIMVLHHGQLIAEGSPGEISASRTVVEVYLGEC